MAQVYHYIPPSHFDIETNPSILTSERYANKIEITQMNSLQRDDFFNYSRVNLSGYLKSRFTGLGLSFVNTSIKNDFSVNHVGIGAGYRNVLFDVVYIRLGAFYKINFCNSPAGNFDLFSFTPQNSVEKKQVANNLNLSMSVSSGGESYYASFSVLNIPIAQESFGGIVFPRYFVLNLGNAASFWYRENSLIAYTLTYRNKSSEIKSGLSHYLRLASSLPITRRLYLEYGLTTGYVENEFFSFSPHLKVYTENTTFKFALNLYPNRHNITTLYNPVLQISLNYII
jgi:hypothetical protein